MGTLTTSLLNAVGSMRVFNRQLTVVQNNIANASAPGYVRQTQVVKSDPLQLETGRSGGISAGGLVSARDEFAEDNIRRQQSLLGEADQKATDLGSVESAFDLSSPNSVSGTLASLFASFSSLAVNPASAVARATVLNAAGNLATSINQTASALTNAGARANQGIQITVDAVNRIAGQIRDINAHIRETYMANTDAGVDAQMHTALEELSQYVSFTTLKQTDGTVSLYFGGQVALVVGAHQFEIKADYSDPNTTRIRGADGDDLTAQATSGKLAAQLQEKNTVFPGYLAGLNTLAKEVSDQVNQKLAGGLDASGNTPAINLFSYDATFGAARTMKVTAITEDQIAAASAGSPGGNGNALDIADLLHAKAVNGFTFIEHFGNLGAQVGRDIANAKQDQQDQSSLVAQAHSLRDQVSGVDINEEAAKLLEIQRAYQAAGKIMNILNELTDTVIGLIQ
jgi:flagellar hook-associated protein 1 FlgK